jgi:phosphatidylglycerophosphatase A
MIKKINIQILSMFSIGFSKYAPGTVASFITFLLFIIFYIIEVNIFFLVLCVCFIFIYAVFSIDKYNKKFSEVDAKEIVIDEFIGQSIPILTIYNLLPKGDIFNFIIYAFISFILFRFFDIAKPYPIYKVDKNMKNGFGVMFDDVIAGVYTAIVLLITMLFTYYE